MTSTLKDKQEGESDQPSDSETMLERSDDNPKGEMQSSNKVGGVFSNSLISVSEIFGPTIQGEGALIGTQTIFVRTGGCDYRCSWCDTGYAVLPKYEDDWQKMSAVEVFTEIEKLSNQQPTWITLSGGNPAQQDLEELITLGQSKGYQFSMETQGSIAQPWFYLLDQLTLSPKPPSSGMSFKQRGLDRCLAACGSQDTVSLKFVVADKTDLLWSKALADKYPQLPCYLQPCNTSADINNLENPEVENQASAVLDLFEEVKALNWTDVKILPQLHTWLWGNKSGV